MKKKGNKSLGESSDLNNYFKTPNNQDKEILAWG